MKDKQATLRLIYPQWQGGVVTSWFPDLPPEDASKGYYLGSKLLNFLAPNNNQASAEAPIFLEYNEEGAENNISRRNAIVKQTKSAFEILTQHNPERIVTLGGECSVSVAPFTYLANKYRNDVALVWIDTHPDINIPGDEYTGYHAMALTACIGMGDEEIINSLPAKFDPSKVLIAGLHQMDKDQEKRMPELGIKSFSPENIRNNPDTILNWLNETEASKVVIHFDLDVLDPNEMLAAVGREPNGMEISEVLQIIKEIEAQYDIIGLTVAEHFPDIEIKLKKILEELPLLN
jgi:arginase